jgi:hypothetical protein
MQVSEAKPVGSSKPTDRWIVWAIAAGPILVVVAGLITAWIAVSNADKLIEPSGQPINHETPAHKARNMVLDQAPAKAR